MSVKNKDAILSLDRRFGMATLSASDQRRIDSIIEDLCLRTGFSYPAHSLLDLAQETGIKVVENRLTDIDPKLSGALLYDSPEDKTNPRIFIDSNMPAERKQFTLAHELGHHFLHKGRVKLRLDKLDYTANDRETLEESEANYFAASLLVPRRLLEKKIEDGYNIFQLAKYFKVSVPVIENRIRWIKTN